MTDITHEKACIKQSLEEIFKRHHKRYKSGKLWRAAIIKNLTEMIYITLNSAKK